MGIEAILQALVRDQPGLKARELARELQRQSPRRFESISKADINPTLYSRTDLFVHDGRAVPRWHLVGQDTARSTVTDATLAIRERLRELDSHVAVPALAPPPPKRPPAAEPAPPESRAPGESISVEYRPHLSLLPWQSEAMRAWSHARRIGIIEAVTGTGKTHLGLEAIAQCVKDGSRATVLVPSLLLMRQWRRRLAEFLPHVSVATLGGGGSGDARVASVIVATVQSAKRPELADSASFPSLLVADEVHRYGSPGWRAALDQRYRLRLGLTATLERSSDDGVAEVLLPFFGGFPVMQYQYARAVPEQVVAPFDLRFFGVSLEPRELVQYDDLSSRMGKARGKLITLGVRDIEISRDLGRLASRAGEIGSLARKYAHSAGTRRLLLANCEGKLVAIERMAELVTNRKGTVVFTQTKSAAHECARRLRRQGVETVAVDDETSYTERQGAIDDLTAGTLAAIAAPKILDEGVDIPNLDLGIVLGASSSRRQMIQRLGRIIRRKEDGRSALFVVMFAVGTIEDPRNGAHEGFIGIAREAARSEHIITPHG